MRHPFDGINKPNNEHGTDHPSSRRVALRLIAGAGAAVPLATGWVEREANAADLEAEAPTDQYNLYFVVPAKFRSFSTRRRSDLGVNGSYLPGLVNNEALKESKGFLAWLTEEQSETVSSSGDVEKVHRIEPADVSVQGAPPEKGPASLRVYAAPFQWNAKISPESHLSIDELGEAWSKQFSMHEGVKVVANKAVRTPFITFADGKVPEVVIETIKQHPQVYALEWMTPVGPTTKRLGEEGGATTLRVGEEGGVTTQALGEEGGVTTRALGEEGGPRPSTKALGEEGGVVPRPRPTTLAIGEEGGRGKAPAILPKEPPQKLTTQALGEEGGSR